LVTLVVLLAGGLKTVDEYVPPTRLAYASVLMRSGELVEGFYLAENSNAVIIAPNVYDRTVGFVSALPRSQVANVSLSDFDGDIRGLDQQLQRPLLGHRPPTPSPDEADRQNAIVDFLATIRADIGWRYPPVIPLVSVEYLVDQFDDFSDRPHPWRYRGEAYVRLADLLEDPQLYVNETIVTEGTVLRAHSWEDPDSGYWTQFLLLGSNGDKSEANCWLTRYSNDPLVRVGDRIRVLAAVAGWGTWNGRSAERVPELTLACSAMSFGLGELKVTPKEALAHAGRPARLQVRWRLRHGVSRLRALALRLYDESIEYCEYRVDVRRRRIVNVPVKGFARSPVALIGRRFTLYRRGRDFAVHLVLRPHRLLKVGRLRLEALAVDSHGRQQLDAVAGMLVFSK
jgi:hypothetical protein